MTAIPVPKTWLSADGLLADSFRLARQVLDSGFIPTHIAAIWRGGAPVGIAVQELLAYRGIACDHIAIRTASYTGIDRQEPEVRVHALGYLVETLGAEDRLLIVDDVFDTGRSVQAVLDELAVRCGARLPREIRIATVYWKPARNRTALVPDYHVHQTDEWLVFPHEICGLTEDEIRRHKPQADTILEG